MRLEHALLRFSIAAFAFALSNASQSAEGPAIPVCDKYFAMVESCAPKLSKDDQEAVRSSVNMLRTMKPIANSPQGSATLEQRCTASLKELQNDKYGCDGAKR